MEIKLIEHDVRKQHVRFYELLDLYYKKNGRQSLSFDDNGYVEDPDLFITGCLSRLIELHWTLDGFDLNWEVVGVNGCKQFKTLLDFCEGKIKCQDMFVTDLEPHMRDWISHRLQIVCHVINPGANDREQIRTFFKTI